MFWIVSIFAGLCLIVSICFRNDTVALQAAKVLNGAFLESIAGVTAAPSGARGNCHEILCSSAFLVASYEKAVAADQKWRCAMCGELLDEAYEIDHIVPLFRGGLNNRSNLQALCPKDHRLKSAQETSRACPRNDIQ